MNFLDYRQVARLFLLEPDQPTCESLGGDARFSAALPFSLQDARVEFARLFTLSVYPYASIFLDEAAVLNGDSTGNVERFYERVGFGLRPEWMLGAPDALGAELECMACLVERGDETSARSFLCEYVLPWAPVCCVSVERNAQLELYRTLAQVTRNLVMSEAEGFDELADRGDEHVKVQPQDRDLLWVVEHLMTPRKCGFFLSKNDLRGIADQVQIPMGFGDRGLLLATLLKGAGSQGRVPEVLGGLQDIVRQWKKCYGAWTKDYPRSSSIWREWHARAESTDAMLTGMLADVARLGVEQA